MRKIIRIGLLALAAALGLASAPGAPGVHSVRQDRCQAILNRAVRAGLVGLAVYIKTPEEGVWIGTGGYSDLASRTRIQPDSLFYSASHLKIITATAVFMLWDAGLIDLEAPIDRYLPPDVGRGIANASTITVRDLLGHTSGIVNYRLASPWDNDPGRLTWRDDLESLSGREADFSPGARFGYSNSNYLLLAVIIDRIAGDHADFLARNVFRPLGMTRTYYRTEPGLPRPPGLVTPYADRFGTGDVESIGAAFPLIRQSHAYGAGGLLADLSDYALFSEALFGGQLVSQAALARMTALSGPGAVYGCGLGVFTHHKTDEPAAGPGYGHGGRGYFGILEMDYYPKAGVTIGFASNYGYSGFSTTPMDVFGGLAAELADAVFHKPASPNPPATGSVRAREGR